MQALKLCDQLGLVAAATTVLAAQEFPAHDHTQAVQDPFSFRDPKARDSKLTYAKDIAPILAENCQTCHRPGEGTPFSMTNYATVRAWASNIKKAVLARHMPPWYEDGTTKKFENYRGLSQSDINKIAAQTARFYASDVFYKNYAAPEIAAAVNAAGVRFSPLNGDQFVPDVQWVLPSFIATRLHVAGASTSTRPAPGIHGHRLDSVSVGGTTLTPGGSATLPASPPPTFTLTFRLELGVAARDKISSIAACTPKPSAIPKAVLR